MTDLTLPLTALSKGHPCDAFALLGLHKINDHKWTIKTFQPQADQVKLTDHRGNYLGTMVKIIEEGIFSIDLTDPIKDYRLSIKQDQHHYSLNDPYQYPSLLGELDHYLIGEGKHHRLYEKLGAHIAQVDKTSGVYFSVWAPNAAKVSVIGHFNDWDGRRHCMRKHPSNGVWDIFIPDLCEGTYYKFEIKDAEGHLLPLKADPFARQMEPAPGNASIVHRSQFQWHDDKWQQIKATHSAHDKPMSVYEVHAGSWRRAENNRYLSWNELADSLIPYVKEMGFTHIELLPITEYPFDGSWGYQPIGLFSPTWRHGDPDQFKQFIDQCHLAGIGVIIDWVPAHFPRDDFGLAQFDGTHLYEHQDPRQGAHQDWGTLVFNYGRSEVCNYLIANALFWIEEYHIDALRVDAVASMLYLDYSREDNQWVSNQYGGNENLEAIEFLKRLNIEVHQIGGITIAEESTAWPGVSKPTYDNGLGFSYKWNMGWMNDSLEYIKEEPIHRSYHQNKLTFSFLYAFDEHFMLPLSHDEVVHGKGSILTRMPGDDWQKFANLRAYYGYMFGHPGRKLLFMGNEFAQGCEWNHAQSLDWHQLDIHWHHGVKSLVRDLNHLYRSESALHEHDSSSECFQWIDCSDHEASVIAFIRKDKQHKRYCIVITHMTPVVRQDYRLGVPSKGHYSEKINTDADAYGGSGVGNLGQVETQDIASHGFEQSVSLTLPPLSTIILTCN